MSRSNILFILTGSIAGYKACEAISQLVQRGHRVRTVTTEAARHFIGEATLEGLTGERVATGLFSPGAALEHVELTRWADVVAICPATANTINRLAAGLADDLTGALFLAHDRRKPFLVAPAMNPEMWRHPATVEAVRRLREWDVQFLPVGDGRTACGETGEGRLAEPEDIVRAIEAAVTLPAKRLRVLVTSGGTAEPVDSVRVLTNLSTGQTGAGLAAHFSRRGHEVVLLRSRAAAPAGAFCREEIFLSFAELDAALTRLLGAEHFDLVIHAAAVGDFSVAAVIVDGAEQKPGAGKLDSGTAPLLRLRANPKLVGDLRARSRNPAVRIVAFKLTAHADEAAVQAAVAGLFEHDGVEVVVHNDLAGRLGGDAFPADIHLADDSSVVHCATRTGLATALELLLTARPAATIST